MVYTEQSRAPRALIRTCIMLATILTMTTAGRVLLLPFPWPSHYKALEKIGMELSRRGHEVHVIMPSTENYRGNTVLNKVIYRVPSLANNTFVSIAEDRLESGSGFGLSWLVQYVKLLDVYGRALLEDKAIAKHALKADLVLSDTAFLVAPIFASYYNLPLVFLSPFGHLAGCMADVLGNVENPSYVHTFVSTSLFEKIGFSQRMDFFQRSFNLFANVMSKILRELITLPILRPLTEKYSRKTLLNLWRETALVLIPMDYSVEYPRPESPNVKMVGPLTTRDSLKPLPKKFSDIFEKSSEGVVVVSFGITNALHPKHVSLILESLVKIKYTVIWRYNIEKLMKTMESNETKRSVYSRNSDVFCKRGGASRCNESALDSLKSECQCDVTSYGKQTIKIAEHIHVFDWLPQQELLQQKKTVLLITHCGINSLYEALYHATQVLCLPLFGEQFDNAGRVVSRNLGKALRLQDLTEQSLHKTIQDLIKDETSKQDVIKVSKRLRRSKENAAEKAAHWIEVVLAEKGDMSYLRPAAADLSYIVYFSLDIMLFWGLVMIVVYVTILKIASKATKIYFQM